LGKHKEIDREKLQQLVEQYYTLLYVIHEGFWQEKMGPFWNKKRQQLQQEAEALGIKPVRPWKAE